jgi:hypothetical protein
MVVLVKKFDFCEKSNFFGTDRGKVPGTSGSAGDFTAINRL